MLLENDETCQTVSKPETLAKQFDTVMRDAGGKIDKREVAECLGVRVASDAFRTILSRRKVENKVRAYRGSPTLIEWIKREWTMTKADSKEQAMVDLRLPLDAHEYVTIPTGSISGVAGITSACKTGFMLETAELNVYTQPLPIYYWYMEMSEAKLNSRLEDFPILVKAREEGKFIPVKQKEFEFPDVIVPTAINLTDYLDRDDAFYLIAEDIRALHAPLTTGIAIFAQQKSVNSSGWGQGGIMTGKLSGLYIALDVIGEGAGHTIGNATFVKCNSWVDPDVNPKKMHCQYITGGLHGKIIKQGEWRR